MVVDMGDRRRKSGILGIISALAELLGCASQLVHLCIGALGVPTLAEREEPNCLATLSQLNPPRHHSVVVTLVWRQRDGWELQ